MRKTGMSEINEQRSASKRSDASEQPFVAYYMGRRPNMQIVPASRWRDWMNATANRNANLCLPLLAGNEYGWVLLNTRRLVVEWSGGDARNDLQLGYDGPPPPDGQAQSSFGY